MDSVTGAVNVGAHTSSSDVALGGRVGDENRAVAQWKATAESRAVGMASWGLPMSKAKQWLDSIIAADSKAVVIAGQDLLPSILSAKWNESTKFRMAETKEGLTPIYIPVIKNKPKITQAIDTMYDKHPWAKLQ